MRIIHSGTFEANSGGVATCIYEMLLSLKQIGIQGELFSYEPKENAKLVGTEIDTHYTKRPIRAWWNKLLYSPDYKRDLEDIGRADVYHVNGIWLYDTYAMIDVAKKMHTPYVVMPHGMLYPQDIRKSNFVIKEFFLHARLLKDLNNAACVLATCDDEMKHCRNLGVRAPIAIIPNSIRMPRVPEKIFQSNCRVIGYIGRISRRKNVEGIIYAWNYVKNKSTTEENKKCFDDSKLVIIGDGDEEYMTFLKREVQRLNLKNVEFTGFLSGKRRDEAMLGVDVFCMPSEFENFGMVIAESLARGIPCIATKGAPWKDLETENCGWWVEYSQEEINKAVEAAFLSSRDQLERMGKNGKSLVKKKYTLDVTARQFEHLYRWICKKAEKPEFVYIV